MTNRVWWRIALPLATIAALSGCGTQPTYATVEDAVYAGALCTDRSGTRVPDDYCPIGDGDVAGYPYQWRYHSYRATDHDLDVVYVGYPVNNTWSTQRPNVTTLNIDRGSFPADPPKGSRATSATVETVPVRKQQQTATTSSQRGGLGSTTGRNAATTAAATPAPAPAAKAATRKALAPQPASARPMGSSSSKSKGGK